MAEKKTKMEEKPIVTAKPDVGPSDITVDKYGPGVKGPKEAKPAKRDDKLEKKDELTEKERIESLKKFTKEVLKKYGPLIRSIVLFGSTARRTAKGISDIDVFVIVDDTRQKITPQFKEKLESDLDVFAKASSKLMSVQQPYMLTEFWRLVREGHPIVFNFIREGIPVYDKDIFLPIKRLLQMGEIKPSKEAVEKFIDRGPKRIKRVQNAKMYMVVEDCYYAMIETLQAVLMFMGKTPPRPSDAANAMRKALVESKLCEAKFADQMEQIIEIRKDVEHKKIKSITGITLDKWIDNADKFAKKMQNLIVKIEILKRENMVEKSHAIMLETVNTLLKALKKPAKGEGLDKAFKTYLVEPGLVHENYMNVFSELGKMEKLVKAGKVMDIPKQDILMHREYVRKFIREAGKVLKKKPESK